MLSFNMAYRPYMWRKNNPEKRKEQNKREKIRRTLRKKGILPPHGEPMTEEQQKIYDEIGNNDFSYWDSIKDLRFSQTQDPETQRTKIKSKEYIVWYRSKEHAKIRNKEFNIEVEDVIIPEYCPYFGFKLETDVKKFNNPNYYTIDRIDSSKGYIKGNIQVISRLANTMKNSATEDELIKFAESIIKIHKS
jgi:hypothetical protein